MNSNVVKILLYLPALWFVTFVILVAIGCISCWLGASDGFYCTVYCKLVVGLFVLANLLTIYLTFRKK